MGQHPARVQVLVAVAHGNRTHRGRLSAPATGFEDRASHQIRKRYREGNYQVSARGRGRKRRTVYRIVTPAVPLIASWGPRALVASRPRGNSRTRRSFGKSLILSR